MPVGRVCIFRRLLSRLSTVLIDETESVATIESILRDGLETIPEESEVTFSSSSPRSSAGMQMRSLSARLSKRQVSNMITAVADSYVRMMNGFMYKGNYLGEPALINFAVDSDDLYQASQLHLG